MIKHTSDLGYTRLEAVLYDVSYNMWRIGTESADFVRRIV